MAKQNNVVIAYFPSVDKANSAAGQLKDWDKASDAIKLGGIGILTWENGKIKTQKVGSRDTGKGAMWGTILGATLGVLSGGVTLVGGALVGAGAGAIGGALFHKGLGLTDADKANLEDHLKKGGAALVAMASDDEVDSTQKELTSLGGKAASFAVPDDTTDKIASAKDVPAVEPAAPADDASKSASAAS